MDDLLSASWSLYDGSTVYNDPPDNGVPSGQRALVCLADSSNICQTTYNANYTRLLFSDEQYVTDAYGNRTQVKRYTGYGYYVVATQQSYLANSSGEQRSSSTYDSLYHTYVLTSTNALTQTSTTAYDYALGVATSETGLNGVTTSGEYDAFGRLVKVIRPGDSSGSPSVALSYFDNATPFYTAATQKIDGSTSFTVRKYYDGLGRLVQTQQVGAVVGGTARDVRTDSYFDAYGRVIQQSMPYDTAQGTGFSRTGSSFTYTAYDVLGRTLVITGADNTAQTFVYSDTLVSNIPYLETKTTDANGHATTSRSDLWGRAALVTPPTGPGVSYAYNPADQC